MPPLCKEEKNNILIGALLNGVTPRAVRTYFDREFPPSYLQYTLNTNNNTLLNLQSRRIINQAQWNILNPRNGVPDSKTFDVTLMICLIRNLTSINPPINGFDSLPPPTETTPGSDLARIKYYRNQLAHHDSNRLSTDYFKTAWSNLADAVRRLGGQTMSQECQELEGNIFNQEFQGPIPPNIRDQIKLQIDDWEKRDKMCVSTRAIDYVMECLNDNNCLTLTAPSGVGKTFISRHTALVLQRKGYTIIPVYAPTDIRDYYQPGKHTVFIVDDICGNFTANQQQIDSWEQLLPVINTIIADTCCKIIVSCRLQVFRDEQFNRLSPFKFRECNLVSDKLCLTFVEKTNIANTYIGKNMKDIDDFSQSCDFFPLLCSLQHDKKTAVGIKEFFKHPFVIYERELKSLSQYGDEGNTKLCSLALCVLFSNKLEENWLQGTVSEEQRHILGDACNACGIDSGTSKSKIKKTLDTLDGTFICKQNGIYSTAHDKLFDFLAHFFSQTMIQCLIHHGDCDLVHARFIWQKSPDPKTSNIDFIIEIPDDYKESYLERFIKDWLAGKVTVVFNNTNMQLPSFRQKLLEHIERLDKTKQMILVNIKDTVRPKEDYGSGTTPLVWHCYTGYIDMVRWILRNDVIVDQCRDDGVNGLNMASQKGHTDVVKLLLEKDPNVDLCDNDNYTPLFNASRNGHTNIVKLLLVKDPNVDICGKNDCSPLHISCQKGHTDIVELLLKKNPKIDQCISNGCSPLLMASEIGKTDIVELLLDNNHSVDLRRADGCSPLCMASQKGFTVIVKKLLEKGANVNLFTENKMSPLFIASQNGHTNIVKLLLKEKANVNLCDIDDCSPLYMASQEGYTNIVKSILERNPDVNLCDKKGWTPLIKASVNGHTDIVRLLLEWNPDPCDNTPLSTSYVNDNTSISNRYSVQRLMKHKPDVNVQTFDGGHALYFSALNGHIQITHLLLENNADSNICIHSKQCIAEKLDKDPIESFEELKQKVFDSLVRNTSPLVTEYVRKKSVEYAFDVVAGSSPLHIACFMGRNDVVSCLLDHNANINHKKEDGTTPIFYACEVGHADIVHALLHKGADLQICRTDGKYPLDIATDNGHTFIE